MSTPHPDALARNGDSLLRQRIRAEVRALLNQRAELAHLEKMAAVREKTMRVAHDIRNPLATIQAVCGSLILETEDPEQRERLQLISSQVDALASALTGAVSGATDPEESPSLVDLGALVRSLVNLLQYQTPDALRLRVKLEPDLCCLLPERGLARSLYHLLRNAAEALGDRPEGEIRLRCERTGDGLAIEVEDNGPGLPSELIDQGLRAFAAARGCPALGLCSVERFVANLGGRFALGNRETGGAWVSMLLPVECVRAHVRDSSTSSERLGH